ncbi:RNA 3'-terminal phosphate cyclase [Myxococcota bacterium]|nr:RNA 3'-terminal phosphate cyclase [Myxococcota bacterium]
MALVIDGSQGEGGGQILRTSLALSVLTNTPVELIKIRAGRVKPGLLRQHLTAVRAAERISGAEVIGAELGSQTLSFRPSGLYAGQYHFSIGSAGSASLVLQTILPPLLHATGPSTVTVEGGTHNSMSPPFDFLAKVFAPLVARMGARLDLVLERPGFYPAGGGRLRAEITPAATWRPFQLVERGAIVSRRARAIVSKLPRHVAERELSTLRERLAWTDRDVRFDVEVVEDAVGPGNVLVVELGFEHGAELVTGFGEKGKRAEDVAAAVADEVAALLGAGVPVGEHLADQLLLPLAIGAGGVFRTLAPTPHTTTNVDVIRRFLPIDLSVEPEPSGSTLVRVDTRR